MALMLGGSLREVKEPARARIAFCNSLKSPRAHLVLPMAAVLLRAAVWIARAPAVRNVNADLYVA